ncbi:hypothetical protein [Candidatus Amarolinea aalborgensis]|uniref:hypothetical protein n=1 Tax=Candidatus Amarolinea aalborgensis TaxID=2249329 RepID=UPI003BF9C91B
MNKASRISSPIGVARRLGQIRNHSSEAERRKPPGMAEERTKITIDREEVLTVDKTQLPADAEFKGYEDSVVRMWSSTDNVLYPAKEVLLTERAHGCIWRHCRRATGQFGPGIKALALVQYFAPATWRGRRYRFFANVGIQLSAG